MNCSCTISTIKFQIVGQITDVEVIASGPGIRTLRYLRKAYGRGHWRKLKGLATIQLQMVPYIE